ncbi:hypothetical protein D3C87_1853560 [compost metagenome]
MVHRAAVAAGMPALNVGEAWIGVDQRSFDLEYGCLWYLVTMNDVQHIKTGVFYRPDAVEL